MDTHTHLFLTMKFVDSSVSVVETHTSLKGIYEDIERAGRYSYQSVGTRYFNVPEDLKNDKSKALIEKLQNEPKAKVNKGAYFDHSYYISIPNALIVSYPELLEYEEENLQTSPYYENITAEKFVEKLKNAGHLTPTEFGCVYLTIAIPFDKYDKKQAVAEKYMENPYSRVSIKTFGVYNYAPRYWQNIVREQGPTTFYCITTNVRVLIENNWLEDLTYLSEPSDFHEKRVTVTVNCSIGISREWNRHRNLGIVEMSTRYCNFSKDKFGNELTFIVPEWAYKLRDELSEYVGMDGCTDSTLKDLTGNELMRYLTCKDRSVAAYYDCLETIEKDYIYLTTTEEGYTMKPQEARGILPLDLQTKVIYTGFVTDWLHFFDLRTAKGAHPDIQKLAIDLKNQFETKDLI